MAVDSNLGVTYTYNFWLQSMDVDCARYVNEMAHMGSADVSGMDEFDLERIRSYIEAMKTKRNFVEADPHRDLVETKGDTYDLLPITVLPKMEDRAMYDMCHQLNTMRQELRRSASTRMNDGLNTFDAKRWDGNMARLENYLDNYVLESTPLDTPLTSPIEQTTGVGNRTVK